MAEPLNLVRIPFRADGLVRVAKRRHLSLRNLDEGYLAHALLKELWQDQAPAPFLLRGDGRLIDAWGYTSATAEVLRDHARDFGDPLLLDALAGLAEITSKPMPDFAEGRRLGFLVRVCPIVRLSSGRGGKAGREVDAFVARCLAVGKEVSVSREVVYREWFETRAAPQRTGARVERVTVDAFARERFVRRTQAGADGARQGKEIERPDVRLSGELVVENTEVFASMLRHGIGRHKAFGFGMMLIVPPGRSWQPPNGSASEGG